MAFAQPCLGVTYGLFGCRLLQALFANDDFVEAMLSRRLPSSDSVPLRLRKALCLLALSYQRSVSLADLHAVLPEPFNGYGQQDATEFARLLLDTLTSPEDAAPGKAPSLDDKALAVVRWLLYFFISRAN
jgi:hypothetical protein